MATTHSAHAVAKGTSQLRLFLNRTRRGTDLVAIVPLLTAVALGVTASVALGARDLARNPDVVVSHADREMHADPTGRFEKHECEVGTVFHEHRFRRWLRGRYFPEGHLETQGPFLQGPFYRRFVGEK